MPYAPTSPSPIPVGGATSQTARRLAAVLLVLQGLLWGGGSILEAKAAAESLSRSAHVEDQSTTACPPIHSHLDCLICRTLTAGATGGSAAPALPLVEPACEWPSGSIRSPAHRGRFGTLGSRAPPRSLHPDHSSP